MTAGPPGAGQGPYDGETDLFGRRRQPADPNAGWQQQGAEHPYHQQQHQQHQQAHQQQHPGPQHTGQYPVAGGGQGQYGYGQQQYGYQGDPTGQYPVVPSQQPPAPPTDPGMRAYQGLGVQGYTQGGYPGQGQGQQQPGDPYGYQGGDNPYGAQGGYGNQYTAPAYQQPQQPQQPVQNAGGWGAEQGHGWQAQQQAHTGWDPEPRPPASRASRSRREGDLGGGFLEATDAARTGQRAAGGGRVRRVWPQRLAIAVLLGVAMVVSWYWVFPWLENILPSEF